MSQINLETARYNMVEQQIRPWEVLDQRVLDLIARSPREEYVPERYRNLAYADMNIPLGQGQVMMPPKLEARLLQALEIDPNDTILEIGTGSGYLTSLLASLGKHVYSVEILPQLNEVAEKRLSDHGITNVTLEVGDGANGWEAHQPYDVIIITGSLPFLPESFPESLANGGRLIAIVGKPPVMDVTLARRVTEHGIAETTLFETDLPPLINARERERFIF